MYIIHMHIITINGKIGHEFEGEYGGFGVRRE